MTSTCRRPRALRPGDRLAIVAPASPFDRAEFEAGLAELRALGFEPVFDDRVFARRGYVAGDEALRAAAFVEAWHDPAVAGLVAVRGGYGSVQVLPRLAAADLARTPKVFVGYSDVTSVLTLLTCHRGLVSFHGPSVVGRLGGGAARYDRDSFLRVLTEPGPAGDFAPDGVETFVAGEASGPLFGGTLTQLAASLGTPFAFEPPPGAVLLLEDVGERPYRIDRLLTQLRLAGILARAAGIVLGCFPGCEEPDGSVTTPGVLADLLRGFPGPVVFGYPTGHVDGPAVTLPLGVRVRVVAAPGGRGTVVVEEGAVEA